jgi:HK97 gp10 family phage protein
LSVDSNFDKIKQGYVDVANTFESDIDKELNRIGDLMVERASADAPVDTGYMASHIEKKPSGQGNVTVTAIAEYSGYVDLGTYKMTANPFFTKNVELIESTEIPNIEKNLQTKIETKLSHIRS